MAATNHWFPHEIHDEVGEICCPTSPNREASNPKWYAYVYIYMAVCQNLVPLVNIKIAGKWMFIPLKMVLIGIDPYPYIYIYWNSIYVICVYHIKYTYTTSPTIQSARSSRLLLHLFLHLPTVFPMLHALGAHLAAPRPTLTITSTVVIAPLVIAIIIVIVNSKS